MSGPAFLACVYGLLSTLYVAYSLERAPLGYEDAWGFHFGEPPPPPKGS